MKPGIRRLPCLCAAFLASAAVLISQITSPADLVRQGRRLSNQGKQTEALALYRQALQIAPDSFDAHLAAGIVLDLQGQYAEARTHLEKAVQLASPGARSQALRTMAMSYAFEGNAKEATRCESQVFDAHLAAHDFNAAAETADELARIDLESGDIDAARHWYKKGHETALRKTDLSPAEKDLWDFRWEHAQARIAARLGHIEEAHKHAVAAKAILDKGTNPAQMRFYPYLTGYIAFYAGDYKQAIADLQQADQRDPFILSLLAQAYEKSGGKAKAMEYYRKILDFHMHNPTNAFARPLAMKKVG